MHEQHSCIREGQTYTTTLRCCIHKYPKHPDLYDDVVDATTVERWIAQGKGFTLELSNYSNYCVVLKWNELQDPNVVECCFPI
jgi:hypothetical protein